MSRLVLSRPDHITDGSVNRFARYKMLLLAGFLLLTDARAADSAPTESILREFVESYRTDPMAMTATFGIKVGEDWWHVISERVQEPYPVGRDGQYTFHRYGPHHVGLHDGPPEDPTWYFRFEDGATLEKIHAGEWTASTASAQSTPSDDVALKILPMKGFTETKSSVAISYQVMEHFWKADPAEVTRFSRAASLPSHGAALVALYTMKDKRIGWFSLGQDEAANADRNLDRSQVPNLFIFTKGKGTALIGTEEIEVESGMSVFVGPYVRHVIYNTNEEPLEGILVLFGDNVDYATGESYLDFLEREYGFYDEPRR